MDAQTAPRPPLRKRILAQPGWWAGLALGGGLAAALVIGVLPRLAVAPGVADAEDHRLAVAGPPLAASEEARLDVARRLIAAGRAEDALQALEALVAHHPESQEARWLLATIHDARGEAPGALRHYRAYVEAEARRRARAEARLARARSRIADWEASP